MYSRLLHFIRHKRALASVRKAGLWFVDIPRTSSSSIRTELCEQFGPAFGKADLLDQSYNVRLQSIPSHLTALDMRQQLGINTWDRIFTFTVVRNPWDRMLSLFNYRRDIGDLEPGISYKEYLELFDSPPETHGSPFHYHGYSFQAIDYLVDKKGKLLVDHIVRYEQRSEGLAYVTEKCGCKLGQLYLQSSPNSIGYREQYDQATIDMVRSICKRDIEAFDYEF